MLLNTAARMGRPYHRKQLVTTKGFELESERGRQLNEFEVEDKPEDEPDKPEGQSSDEVRGLITAAARGKLAELSLTKSGETYSGTAVFAGLGSLSGRACTVTAQQSGEDWTVTAYGSHGLTDCFRTAQVTLRASGGEAHLIGRGVLRTIGLFDPGESGVDITATIGANGEAVADVSTIAGQMRLPAGFEGGSATFHGVRIDLERGTVDASSGTCEGTHHILGSVVGKDLRIVGSAMSGHLDLQSAELSSGWFKGKLEGGIDIVDGAWSVTRLGGKGTVTIPGFAETLDVTLSLDLGPSGLDAIKAALAGEKKLHEYVTLESFDIDVDMTDTSISGVGTARVEGLPGFETSRATFEAYSRQKLARVSVDHIGMKLPKVGDIEVSGHAKRLVLANAGLGFATNEAMLEAKLPYLGTVTATTSVANSQLQQTRLNIKKKLGLPDGNPLLSGTLDSTLLFEGTSFKQLDARLPMSLNLGAETLPDIFDLVLAIDAGGHLSLAAAMKSAIRLSKHLSVSGGQLAYDEVSGLGGNLDFEFHDIASSSVVVPMPIQSKASERSVLAPKPGQDAFAYQLEAGFSTTRGPFLEGAIHLGANNRVDGVAGKLLVPAAALLGRGGASYELAASGFKLMEGKTLQRRLVDIERKRFTLMRFPIGGIFAEAGAQLDFSIAADPILADISGRISNLNLSTLTPETVALAAHIQGGLTGRLTGRPVLGIGAFIGDERIARLSGGLQIDVPSVLHGSLPGSVALDWTGGKLQAKGAVNPRLFFGLSASAIPYYDLSVFGGAIARSGKMSPLASVTLFEEQQVAELDLSFGAIDKPKTADEGLDFTLAKADGSVHVPPPEMQTIPPVPVPTEKSEAGGDPTGSFGETAWTGLQKAYGSEPWFKAAETALDFVKWVSEALKISETELQQALDFLKEYIDLKALDERFFSNFKRPDGKAGKMGLIQALSRVVFGREDGTMHTKAGVTEDSAEVTLDSDRVHELRFGLATVRVKQAATPGRVLLVHSPFHGDLTLDQEESRLSLDERHHVTGGTLAAKLALGGWGGFAKLLFDIDSSLQVATSFKDSAFTAGEKLSSASVVLPGAVSGQLTMSAGSVGRVDLQQESTVGMPPSIGGVKLEAPPTKVGFVKRDAAWSLTAANGVSVPLTGGQFTAKLDDYSVSELGVSAKGVVYMEIATLGKAGGNVEIVDNRIKHAELAFERPRFGFPEGNEVVAGNLQGSLLIDDGGFEKANVGVAMSVQTGQAMEPVGTFGVRFAKVGDAWKPAFEATVDPSVLARMKLGDYGQMKAFESALTPEGAFSARGTFDVDLPHLGKLQGATLGYAQGVGFTAGAEVPMTNDLMTGSLAFEYNAGKVTLGGKGKFTPPGLEPFDGELEVGTEKVRVKVDAKQDVLKLKLGDSTLNGSIEELLYDRKTGAFAGRLRISGHLPMVGEVSGEAALGHASDPTAPFVQSAGLRFKNSQVALPNAKSPVVKGTLSGGLTYSHTGVDGTVSGTGLELQAPGVGEGAQLAFEGAYKAGVPEGKLSFVEGKKTEGSIAHLVALSGHLDRTGKFSAAGAVGLEVGGVKADLAATIDDSGFGIAGQNIQVGAPGDRFWARDLAVSYTSVGGLAMSGRGGLQVGGLEASLALVYAAGKGGGKRLSAEATVMKTLFTGGGAKEVGLPGLGPLSFLVLPILPGLLDLYGTAAAEAKLVYDLKNIDLTGSGRVLGLDLSTGDFESFALAPSITGGLVVDLVGGPSFGLMAGVLGGWAAYAKGTVGFMVGGRARMNPRVDGMLNYRKGGELTGGASLEFPVIMSAVGIPTVSAEVGLFGGRLKKDVKGQLDEMVLMEPRQIMNLQLGVGALSKPGSPQSLEGLVPTNPLAGPRTSVMPKGAEIDVSDKKKAPEKFSADERSIAGKAGDTDLAAHKGLFSLDDARKALVNKVTDLRDFIASAYDALSAIGTQLKKLALGKIEEARFAIERTAAWVGECFGFNTTEAKRAVDDSESLEKVPKLDRYEGLIAELEQIRKHQSETLEEDKHSEKEATSGMNGALATGLLAGAGLGVLGTTESGDDTTGKLLAFGIFALAGVGAGLIYSSNKDKEQRAGEKIQSKRLTNQMTPAIKEDVRKAATGSNPEERVATVKFAHLMMHCAVAPVLTKLQPLEGCTVWETLNCDESGHDALLTSFVATSGNMNQFWKQAKVEEIVVWKDFMMKALGKSESQVKAVAKRILQTYWSGWVGGWGNTIRDNFNKAGVAV